MHQPSSTPCPSIYYDYKVFAPWLPRQNQAQTQQQVVIVGAGPAGMVTALELARHGVRSVILESELQVSQGSRAIVFTRRSMEVLQQVGVAERMQSQGLCWRFGNSIYRGQRVFRMEADHDDDDRFGPMLNIQQQYLEQYLLEACEASEWIDIRWGNKLVDFSQDTCGVRLEIDTPEGLYTLQSDWLVAADGGRSDIRQALNLPLEGTSYEGRFVIADIKVELPLPTERLAFFDPPWNPGNTILMHREPHGIWRLDYQLPADETPEQALRPDSLKQRIDAHLAMIGFQGIHWEMDWSSVYSARALTLSSYVHERTVFVGDAAHLLPIFGVRGANTAFQDAQSLGWQLAMVARGVAPAAFLENYSRERVGAAREIIDEAGKSTRFMAPPSKGFRLLRDAVLSLSLTQSFVRSLFHWRTSRPHCYAHSSLNSPADQDKSFSQGLPHGSPPLNVRLADDDYLLDHLGGAFDLLYFSDAEALDAELNRAADRIRAQGIPLRITAIRSSITSATSAMSGADKTMCDSDGRVASRYGVNMSGAAYLLRPDQHVCARWLSLDISGLEATFQHMFFPTFKQGR